MFFLISITPVITVTENVDVYAVMQLGKGSLMFSGCEILRVENYILGRTELEKFQTSTTMLSKL